MTYEVEQKFPVNDISAALSRLREIGADRGEPIVQVDTYFAHPSRDFVQTDEALRIRRVGEENWVTYKGPKIDATTKTRREIELPIGPSDAGAAEFDELLVALGFTQVAEVKKTRIPWSLEWQGYLVAAAVDALDRLGAFIEIEIEAREDELDSAREALASLAVELRLSGSERRSYLELLLESGPVR